MRGGKEEINHVNFYNFTYNLHKVIYYAFHMKKWENIKKITFINFYASLIFNRENNYLEKIEIINLNKRNK